MPFHLKTDALQGGVPRDVNLGAVQNNDGRPDRSAFDFLELPDGFSDVTLDESHAVYAGRVARGALQLFWRSVDLTGNQTIEMEMAKANGYTELERRLENLLKVEIAELEKDYEKD